MRTESASSRPWLDVVMLSFAGVLLLPIVVLALAPVLLTFMVLWPTLILPVLAAPRSLPLGEPRGPRRPTDRPRQRMRDLDPTRQLPQAA